MTLPLRQNNIVITADWFNAIRQEINSLGGVQGIVVGNAADVTAGKANYTSIQAAIDASANGDIINLLGRTFAESIIINKQLKFLGRGYDSIISGTVSFAAGSSGSGMAFLTLDGVATIQTGVIRIQLVDSIWLTGSGGIVQTDADIGSDYQNLWITLKY